jgi:hypothetical protein
MDDICDGYAMLTALRKNYDKFRGPCYTSKHVARVSQVSITPSILKTENREIPLSSLGNGRGMLSHAQRRNAYLAWKTEKKIVDIAKEAASLKKTVKKRKKKTDGSPTEKKKRKREPKKVKKPKKTKPSSSSSSLPPKKSRKKTIKKDAKSSSLIQTFFQTPFSLDSSPSSI